MSELAILSTTIYPTVYSVQWVVQCIMCTNRPEVLFVDVSIQELLDVRHVVQGSAHTDYLNAFYNSAAC